MGKKHGRSTKFEKKIKADSVFSLIHENGNDILLKDLKKSCRELKVVVGNRELPNILKEFLEEGKIVKDSKIIEGSALVCYRRALYPITKDSSQFSLDFYDLIEHTMEIVKACPGIKLKTRLTKLICSSPFFTKGFPPKIRETSMQ
jgi:hypothetical protein